VIDPIKAAQLAKQQGVKVYCIGAGTNGIAPIPTRDPFTRRTVLRGMPVEIDEETLKKIADITGGKYFRATDIDALAGIYDQIDRLERTKVSEVRYLQYTEHFSRFVLSGLGMLAAATMLGATLFRKLP
jgi:Ca-activated chloride channel family protein